MVSGTLYTYPDNFRAYKVLIAAQYAGSKVNVAKNFVFGETNKTKEFTKKFPSGNVPAFETNDGKYLNDANAIAYYVSNSQLRGNDVFQQAEIVQWMDFAESEILPPSCAWIFPIWGIMEYDEKVCQRAKTDVKKFMSLLNTHLLTRTYFVGERISLADITVACTLLNLYKHVMDPSFRQPFPNVNRWFTTIINQNQVISVIGNFSLCKKMEVFNENNVEKISNKETAPVVRKKEKKKSESKEQPEPLDDVPPEPKSSNPFDSLPKGKFDMDDFKRFYSNEEESKSIPYFFEKFDPENYSIWLGEYKYNDELTKVFMSCNLITGMFQRLDKMRKQAFASVCLFGTDNDSSISGIWVWRGKELAFELSPDWQIDYEVYDWKKLDPAEESTKKLVEQYFAWTAVDKQGREFSQGKIFK